MAGGESSLDREVGEETIVRVRVATPSDAQQIANLHAESWRSAYRGMFTDAYLDSDEILSERSTRWSNRFDNPDPKQLVLVVEVDDRLAGFVCAFGDADPQHGTLIDNLHVRKELQRRGIGKRLMSEVAKWCMAELPGDGIFLWVLEPNLPARRFYETLGATYIDRELWDLPDGVSLPSIRYAWANVGDLIVE